MTIKHSQASLAGHRLLPLILLPAFLSQTNAFAIPKALLKRAPTCDATPGNNPILADCQAALNMMPGNGGYQTYAPNNGATPLANNLGPLFYQSGTCVITVNPTSLDYSFSGTIRSITGNIITTCVQGSGIGGTDTSGIWNNIHIFVFGQHWQSDADEVHSNASDENGSCEWSSVSSGDYAGLSNCPNEKSHAIGGFTAGGISGGARGGSGG